MHKFVHVFDGRTHCFFSGILKKMMETKDGDTSFLCIASTTKVISALTKDKLDARMAAAEKRRQAALQAKLAKSKLTSLHIIGMQRDRKNVTCVLLILLHVVQSDTPCPECSPETPCFLHQVLFLVWLTYIPIRPD